MSKKAKKKHHQDGADTAGWKAAHTTTGTSPDCERPRCSIDSSEMRSLASAPDTAEITPGRSCTIRRI